MEIWKDIKGYEQHYEVSNYGNVRAKYREFIGKDGKLKKYHERLLKPDTTVIKRGYVRVTLSKDYKTERFQVHRLVADHFIPNPENKPFVNHIDNNGLNNHVSNLEWCTHSENMVHAQKQGRLFNSQSKGGKKGGQLKSQKADREIQSLIGITKGKWLVLGEGTRIPEYNKRTLQLQCLGCMRIFEYAKTYFQNSIGNACPRCKNKF